MVHHDFQNSWGWLEDFPDNRIEHPLGDRVSGLDIFLVIADIVFWKILLPTEEVCGIL